MADRSLIEVDSCIGTNIPIHDLLILYKTVMGGATLDFDIK
jgi:hypothetical protein